MKKIFTIVIVLLLTVSVNVYAEDYNILVDENNNFTLKDSSNKIGCLICDVGGNPSYDSSIQQTQCIYESASDCPPTKQKYVSSQKLCYKDCPNTLYQIQISF